MTNKSLEKSLDELIGLIETELGENPYSELEKAKKIVCSKNYKQYQAISIKMKDLGISLYNRRLNNLTQINGKIQEIENKIQDIVNDKKDGY